MNLFDAKKFTAVTNNFAFGITSAMAELIDQTDVNDPIARQFLPDNAELNQDRLEQTDPIGDHVHEVVKGLIHRYPDRVLLKPLSICAVYCRFCFRRENVGPKSGQGLLTERELTRAFAYIASHPNICEIIFSGGDPFLLSPRRLEDLIKRSQAIPHVQILRFHSRVPIVEPSLVSQELLHALTTDRPIYLLIHANHAREFTAEARKSLKLLQGIGIQILGQSVLLRGINDTPEALTDLFRTMIALKIKPHYLHHPDRAPGTSHFWVSIAKGQALMRDLRGTISGLCLPTYLLDIPGGFGKVPIMPNALEFMSDGYKVTDPNGRKHYYAEINQA